MAHGPAKCSDIERVREDVIEADARSVRAEEMSLERHRQRVASRMRDPEKDVPSENGP
jgi:hypothetical protein